MEFTYDGGGLGKGADVTLFVDGKAVGKGRVQRTHSFAFALDETLEVGRDIGRARLGGLPGARQRLQRHG